MPAFFPARIAHARRETETLRTLILDVPAEVRASYRMPGQFVQVQRSDDRSYFAIASAPEQPMELLVKRSEGLAEELFHLPAGSALEITEAMGKGFPLETSRGRDVVLFATGSGIAPIRAALHEMLEHRSAYGSITLFFGVRTASDLPYRAEWETLRAQGVDVHVAISSEGAYVQDRFARELPPVQGAEAFLCGVPGMIEGATASLVAAGLPAERIHLNA